MTPSHNPLDDVRPCCPAGCVECVAQAPGEAVPWYETVAYFAVPGVGWFAVLILYAWFMDRRERRRRR